MKWSVVFGLILFFKTIEGGLISKSSIQSCDWGDSNEPTTKDGGGCKEKFVVSMTLKSGQGEVEALYANINQVYTSADSGPSTLKKPFRIEVQKSQTITNYRVYYRGSVNGLPREHTIIFARARHCRDGWYDKHLSCGKQQSLDPDEDFAWDSQGFCCKCSSYKTEIRRPKGFCLGIGDWGRTKFSTGYTTYHPGRKMNFGSSAHCMRMDDLWYDVYDVELPMMLYNITVRLLQYEGKAVDVETGAEMTNWTTISTFFLTPSKTMGRSKDGKVVVELQGDLVGANGPQDFSVKKLLIPSLKVWKFEENPEPPAAYTNGPGDWLLVDDHLVDLSGRQCNKVGVSYTGFKRQNSPCDKPEHSCFTNQPLQLWRHDDELRNAGKPGYYMVHNFGQVHPSTHVNNHSFILRFIHTDLHNSFVTFRIDASDIVFVYNAARGRIVDAYATNFTAVKEVGYLFVEVENTGQLESEYSVVLSECLGRKSTPSKVVSILPGQIANVSFSLQSYKTKGENSLCEVQLYDQAFNLLGTTKVDVTVRGACFCFGECGCICGNETGSIGNSTALPCPTPPPVIVHKSNLARDIFFLVLESIGIHGIVGFCGGSLLVLGCMKLMCGGVFCCRKTKAQEHYDSLIKKGVDPKSPLLVKCTEECRGAKAAKARYKRKIDRLKKIGKDPGLLDDWRNTSYVCGCRDELADIRFTYILKALCFFYFCFFLPFIWLGKKIWWGVFKDTAAKKEAAKKAVLNQAKKKRKLEKYGIIDIAAELKNIEKERDELRGEGGDKKQQDDTTSDHQNAEMMRSAGEDVKQTVAENVGCETLKGGGDKTNSNSKEDGKKQQPKADKNKNSTAKSDRKETKENVDLKKEKQSMGKSVMGSKGTEKTVQLKKEKQLGEGVRERKNTDEKPKKKGEGVKSNNLVKGMEKNVDLKKEKQLGEGVRERKNTDEKPKKKGEGVKPNNQVKGMEKNVDLKKEKQLGEDMRPNDQKCERRKEQPLKKESPGYREGSRAQERTTGRSAVDSGMKSSKQSSPSKSRDDKGMREGSKIPKGPGKSAMKTKELRTSLSAKSTAASHGYAQHGRPQSSAKSEESLSPIQKEVSHASKGSEASNTKLNDDTITKSESAHEGKQDSHTSLASADHHDDKSDDKVESLSAEKSISSQEGSPKRKASADDIKSDTSSKNLEPKPSNASLDSHSDHGSKQSLDAGEENKPIHSDRSEVADPVLSQHSDKTMRSHHSEATPSQQPISSQHSRSTGTLPRAGPGEISGGSDNDLKRSISRESSVRVQRVSSDQFAVRYLSEGRISVTMQSSHHSCDSDTRAAHSRSEVEFSKRHQSGSSVERRSLSVSALISPKSSSSSRISTYSDPPLTASSFNSSSTASTRSSSDSTNTDSKKSTASSSAKSDSTSSAASNSSSDSATGSNSSSSASGQTSSSSSSDLTSKSGNSHRTSSSQLLESVVSSMIPSGSKHSEKFDELLESESNTVSSHHSEAESRSETAHSDENEEYHDDKHTSNSGSEQDSSAESSNGSGQESHSEISSSESQESYTGTSSSSQQSTTTYFSSYSGSEGSISRSHSESGSAARSMSSVSASSSQSSHSRSTK